MKCLVLFLISLGVAMSFLSLEVRDAEDLDKQMTETELEDPPFSGDVAVGHQWNGKRQFNFGHTAGYVGPQGRRQMNGKRLFNFGQTAGPVGQQGTNSGQVAVGNQCNGRK